jgi:hypothetical protein
MVICGHLSTVNYVDKGDQGNTIYQMLFDWQNPESAELNSYCAILELDPDQRTISVKTYSAKFDKYMENTRSQFQYKDVAFMQRPEASKVMIEAPKASPPPPPAPKPDNMKK